MCKDQLEILKRDIGLEVYKIRQENGYSRQEFADMVGISLNSLASIENGDTMVKIGTLFQITNTLSLSMSSFFENINY
ncbi:helix-turn-helix transcriptional regulator [Bacillus sp. SM-B1]|uniref:helix-turn-helix domain-containing protein n=1 Tax=Bacillus sp. SM-B1 TaxID=2980102 RepID=UPI002949A3D9|nr:helix-turn-helix transcriptional regulator [Bacillus sp. SM-B1]MDV6039292.1 helix-turn-helix transcriptional regulator [Bacillus sp. SM-B1]